MATRGRHELNNTTPGAGRRLFGWCLLFLLLLPTAGHAVCVAWPDGNGANTFQSATCGARPGALTGCTITAPAVGGTGAIHGTFTVKID